MQNVGTPRFYVSVLQWLAYIGKLEHEDGYEPTELTGKHSYDLVYIDPTEQLSWTPASDTSGQQYLLYWKVNSGNFSDYMPTNNNFHMVLGHNFGDTFSDTPFKYDIRNSGTGSGGETVAANDIVNFSIENNGFSLAIGNNADDLSTNRIAFRVEGNTYSYGETYKMGSFLYGTFYDMPHSPDLNLTIGYEMDGVKKIRTKAGNDLINYQYLRPPKWGDRAAWEMNSTDHQLARTGRRFWDLSFTMIENSDIFSELSNIYDYTGIQNWSGEYQYTNLLKGNSFYSQVINKTCGGILPFVFQPKGGAVLEGDPAEVNLKSSNNNPDQFAICKLDMDSIKLKQSANGVYDFSIRVKEVW